MELDDLRIVAAVARSGSMNKAASTLNMVQSNVTARVRQLEEELGVQLFVRHSRGVELSEAGLRLLSYSQRVSTIVEEAVSAIKEDGTAKGGLRIGTTETTVGLHLPRLAAQYARDNPRVELAISTGATNALIDQVLQHQLDGAFVSAPVHLPELSEESILVEHLVLVSPLSIRRLDDLKSIENLKIIVFQKECSYRQRLGTFLNALGVAYQVMEFSSLDAIITCITAGVGITLLPDALVHDVWRNKSVSVHRMPSDQEDIEVAFIRRTDRFPTKALHAFLEMVRQIKTLKQEGREL